MPPADHVPYATVSVIVPLHDQADVVGEALASILAQDRRPFEVVVVDDGSRDGGAAVAAQYGSPIRVVGQPRGGAAAARLRGLELSHGDLVVCFDADDRMPAGRLAVQAAALDRDPTLDGVFGDVVQFRPGSDWRSPPRPARLPSSLMMRREALARMGPHALGSGPVEALDWAARADELALNLRYLPGVAVERRLHAGNHGHGTDHREYVRELKTILDRRRAAGRSES